MATTETMVLSRQQQRSDTDFSIATNLPSTPNEAPGQSPRQSNDLSYMHRPPTIMPNYGKKARGSVLPKSSVSRVLLYDNITQQTMLDVRLNSIQSQSYKTNRELEMHMKSFITRRKARQKALKNLTRVQHHDDYFEFQQQQQQQQLRQQQQQRIPFGSLGSDSPEEQRPPGHGNPFLPQIGHRSSSFHPRANHPSPGISGLRKHAKSVNSTREPYRSAIVNNVNGNSACGDEADEIDKSSIDLDTSNFVDSHNKVHNGDCKNVESLPQITMSAPSNVIRSNKYVSGNYCHPLNQNNRVGYKTVKGNNGHTRIFHALQEADFDQKPPIMDSGIDNSHKHHRLLPLRHGSPNRIMRLKERNRRDAKKQTRGDFSLDHDELSLDGAENEDHPEKPLSDFRFLHLRKLLIPQDPPNEGYTELSPSFPRHYPAIRDVVMMAKKRRRKDGTIGQQDEGGSSESDDDSMYSEGAEFSERPDDAGDVGNRM